MVPLGLLPSVVWAVLEFRKDRLAGGAFALIFVAYFLFSYVRRRRGYASIPKVPDEFRFYEVYGFVGGCVLVGVTLFVLAVLGVAHIGMV
jgi:hypothetical protein